MKFNGAPDKVAEKYKNMPYGQKIEIDEKDDSRIRVATTGFPSNEGIWVNAPTIADLATEQVSVGPSKKKVVIKCWWDVGMEQLVTELYYPESYLTAVQRRSLTPEGILKLDVTLTKRGKECKFDAEFKRVGAPLVLTPVKPKENPESKTQPPSPVPSASDAVSDAGSERPNTPLRERILSRVKSSKK
jgi:hypothetical protein